MSNFYQNTNTATDPDLEQFHQELEKMSAEELTRSLFSDDDLVELEQFRPQFQD